MRLLLAALGAFCGLELVIQLVPSRWLSKPPTAAILMLLGAMGLSFLLPYQGPWETVVYGLGGAGLGLVIRKVYQLMTVVGDRIVSDLLSRRRY